MPSGLFLSPFLERPTGSSDDGNFAWSRPSLINLLTSSCLVFRPVAYLHFNPCLPFGATISPHLHSWGWQRVAPSRSPQAMCTCIGNIKYKKHSLGFKMLLSKFILPKILQTCAHQEILDLKSARANCNKVGSSENNWNLYETSCKLFSYEFLHFLTNYWKKKDILI